MKLDHEIDLRPGSCSDVNTKSVSVWRLCGLLILALLVWLFTWYGETTFSTIAIWLRSDTYTHGFLIFPISAYLIWNRRQELSAMRPQPSILGLVALAGLGFAWLLADSAEVLVVSQYALVGMVPAMVWAVLGSRVGLAILFPLMFLFFAVPVGEFLLPPMMNFTADFAVTALRMTGIPVFREGNFFSVPTGSWSVVEACSGLRYLIASLTLGCLFAYLTYRNTWRRIAFIALSIVFPIIANGIRAYLIVMIGHLSNNRLATGVDHVIYGWVFFGFVMLLLFWIGSRWREPEIAESAHSSARIRTENTHSSPLGKIAGFAVAAALIAALWPTYASRMQLTPAFTQSISLSTPKNVGQWQLSANPITDWKPLYLTAPAQMRQSYVYGHERVELLIKYYKNQHQDTELINSSNQLTSTHHSTWGLISNDSVQVRAGSTILNVDQATLRSSRGKLLVWTWYWIGGRYTNNVYLAKLYQAKAKLLKQGDDAAAIFVYTNFEDANSAARQSLEKFTAEMFSSIDATLVQAKH